MPRPDRFDVSVAQNPYPPMEYAYVPMPDGRLVRALVRSMRTEVTVNEIATVTLELILTRDEFETPVPRLAFPESINPTPYALSHDLGTIRLETGDLQHVLQEFSGLIDSFRRRLEGVEGRLDGSTVDRLRGALEVAFRPMVGLPLNATSLSSAIAQAIGSVLAPRREPVTGSGWVDSAGMVEALRYQVSRAMAVPPDLIAGSVEDMAAVVEAVRQVDDGVPTGEPDTQVVSQQRILERAELDYPPTLREGWFRQVFGHLFRPGD